jgi:hypothetical protein
MAYRVNLSALAEMDASAAFERIREAAPIHAEKWLTGLFDAIFSLDEIPVRCPVIPEAKNLAIPPVTCCMAKEEAFIGSSFISGRTSSLCVCCESGTLPAMPSSAPTWRLTMPDFVAYYRATRTSS